MFSFFGSTQMLAYDMLLICVLAVLFIPNTKINILTLVFTIILAYLIGRLSLLALMPIGLLTTVTYLYYKKKELPKVLKILMYVSAVMISVGLLIHKLPGFNNLKHIDGISLTDSSVPYSMWLNFDKPMIGIIILLVSGYSLKVKSKDWAKVLKVSLASSFLCLALLIVPVTYTDILAYDPKLPEITVIWVINMLLFVCFAEEVFFRYFIQGQLAKLLNIKHGQYVAIVITSICFGLVHLPMGATFASFAFLAGIFYGYSYHKTKSIEASIITHFIVNMTHFILFTYPAAIS